MSLQRTQHRNLVTGADLSGSPVHREVRVDLEGYLDPLAAARTAALRGPGVAAGLRVAATAGSAGLRIGPGVAVDARGRTVVLEDGGVAVTARDADATTARNVATVAVDATGVVVDTTGLTGERLLTVVWAEAEAGGATVLRHAPWLQLLPAGDPTTAPAAIALARVVLDAAGAVTALTAGPRTAVAAPAGRLELRAVRETAAPALAVEHAPAAQVAARADGGLDLTPAGAAGPALSVDGTGAVSAPTLSTTDLTATTLTATTLTATTLTATTLTATTLTATTLTAGTATAGALTTTDLTATRLSATRVAIGTSDPGFALDVDDRIRLRQGASPSAGLWLHQTTPNADRAFVGMADDDRVGFWGNPMGAWGVTMDVNTGELQADRGLRLPETGGGFATFTNRVVNDDAGLTANNLKLVMAERFGFLSGPWEFMVGSTVTGPFGGRGFGLRSRFIRAFGVDSNGNAFFAGGKGGYVVDYFVNAVGDTLERGDVVVLGAAAPAARYGTGGAIPIPEVDLTDRAHDRRVCGIVCDVVGAGSLPDPDPADWPEPGEGPESDGPEGAHPFARFAGAADADRTQVGDRQMGRMVTLGAYAFCKVDADVAPVAVGDLLTTSATRGHAQKVTEPAAALGTVLGKAMAPLEAGRGLVPVLVGLQ